MNPLAAYRAEHSLTQVQLAAMLGVHPMTISKWERDLHRIPRAVLLALRPTLIPAPTPALDYDTYDFTRR